MNLTEALNWRYATKSFDPDHQIAQDQLNQILEATRLSASSYGLQAWKTLIISNDDLKKQLREFSFNQAQITDCSHLAVFCVKTNIDDTLVSEYMQQISKTRGVSPESLDGFANMIKGTINSRSQEQNKIWLERQIYIALGTMLAACATHKIDACPMEGFQPEEYNKILKLDDQNLSAVVLCAMGYRSKDDAYASLKKVRFEQDILFPKLD